MKTTPNFNRKSSNIYLEAYNSVCLGKIYQKHKILHRNNEKSKL